MNYIDLTWHGRHQWKGFTCSLKKRRLSKKLEALDSLQPPFRLVSNLKAGSWHGWRFGANPSVQMKQFNINIHPKRFFPPAQVQRLYQLSRVTRISKLANVTIILVCLSRIWTSDKSLCTRVYVCLPVDLFLTQFSSMIPSFPLRVNWIPDLLDRSPVSRSQSFQ